MGRRNRSSRRPPDESDQGYRYAPPEQGNYPPSIQDSYRPEGQGNYYPPSIQNSYLAPIGDNYPPSSQGDYPPSRQGSRRRQYDDYLPPTPDDNNPPPRSGVRRRSGDYLPPRPNDNERYPPSESTYSSSTYTYSDGTLTESEYSNYPERYDYPSPGDYDYEPSERRGHLPRGGPPPGHDYAPTESSDYGGPDRYDYPGPDRYDYPEPESYDYPDVYDMPPPLLDDSRLSKEDYDKVRQRNFDVWLKWRTSLNEEVLAALKNGTSAAAPLPPLEVALQKAPSSSDGPRLNVLHHDPQVLNFYSMATNNVTEMTNDVFLKYGIPRASIDPNNATFSKLFDGEDDEEDAKEERREANRNVVYTVRMRPVQEDDNPTLTRNKPVDAIERWAS